ncbi:MAG: DHA2 family efflux MFS transporter permease subunit [Acidobacteriaceae bacterium]|nr:DHA2 family efflux MFS transporter permease subunit [Acidobacteriaceae bacterium]MBV9500039.1 DHA2 family efflux MFS transporter permease subunit [Acidobacteriaceae bacterium]
MAAPDTSGQNWRPSANPWLIAVSVMLATFMEVLDTSIATVALPYIAGSVSATTDEATWVLTSYLVSNAVVLPASSWFGLRFGRKRFLLVCIVIFTFSSFLCGAAPSLGILLLARAIQGAGGGALQPISQAILLESFPPDKRGLAMAVFGLGVVVAPVLGPTFGGWLTDNYSWRWSFYINIPIGILAVFMILRYVEDPPYIKNARPGRIDAWGLGLLAIWLGCLQVILDKGQEDDWFGAVWIRWASLVLLIALVLFLVRQLQADKPLVDLSIFKNRNFATGCLLITLFGAAIYGLITLLPLFYQELMGYTALNAGIIVSPRGIGAIVAMPIIGLLTARIDNRWLIAFGFFLFAICSIWFGEINLAIGPWSFVWAIILSGFASGMVFVPLSTTTMGTLRNEQIGNASGLYNLLRNVGGSVGISIVNTIVARHEQIHRSDLAHNFAASNPAVNSRLSALEALIANNNGPTAAHDSAITILNSTLSSQARLWSYVDDFRYMALVCFGCLPVVLLFKRASRTGRIHAE